MAVLLCSYLIIIHFELLPLVTRVHVCMHRPKLTKLSSLDLHEIITHYPGTLHPRNLINVTHACFALPCLVLMHVASCLLGQARREFARDAHVRCRNRKCGVFTQVLIEVLSEIRPTGAVWNGLVATWCLAIQGQAFVDVALHELGQLVERGARTCRGAEQPARSVTHFHPRQPLRRTFPRKPCIGNGRSGALQVCGCYHAVTNAEDERSMRRGRVSMAAA